MIKININGVVREMNATEKARFEQEMESLPKPEPTPEERLARLEEENAHLKEALNLLLSGVTDDE